MPKDATAAAAEQMSAEQALKMKQLREELFGAMTEQIKEQKATLSSQREEIRTLQRSYEQLASVAAAERKELDRLREAESSEKAAEVAAEATRKALESAEVSLAEYSHDSGEERLVVLELIICHEG